MKLENLTEEQTKSIVPEGCILLGYRGSIAHNMFIPNTDPNSIDDKDIMGVVIPNKDIYLGLGTFGHHNNGTIEVMQDP